MQAHDAGQTGYEGMRFSRTPTGALAIEVTYRPGASRPPAGFHPLQSERIDVLTGALAVTLLGETRIVRAGEHIVIAPRVTHAAACDGDQDAQVVLTMDPPLEIEAFFGAIGRLAQDGQLKMSVTALMRYAVIARHFKKEFVLATPSRGVQAIVFGLLAPIGRLLGYTPEGAVPKTWRPS